jgi:putative lipoic acid-binding regulatory protein
MTIKTSKAGNYVSATCVIRATSRAQLDAVYQALCEHPMVVMVL